MCCVKKCRKLLWFGARGEISGRVWGSRTSGKVAQGIGRVEGLSLGTLPSFTLTLGPQRPLTAPLKGLYSPSTLMDVQSTVRAFPVARVLLGRGGRGVEGGSHRGSGLSAREGRRRMMWYHRVWESNSREQG